MWSKPAITCTGAKADHRLAVRASDIERWRGDSAPPSSAPPAGEGRRQATSAWIAAVARRPAKPSRPLLVVLAGTRQPPAVHAAGPCDQRAAGQRRPDRSLYSRPSPSSRSIAGESLRDLVTTEFRTEVEMLIILGGNPAYDAPADLRLRLSCCRRCRCGSISACTTMKRRGFASGTCPRPITWNRGAIPALTTARRRSFSR